MVQIITAFLSKIDKRIFIAIGIVLFVAIFIILMAVKDNEIRQKEKEIAEYQENINGLELKTQTLQSEIQFIQENQKLQNSFSNSDAMIKNIDKESLTRTEHETFNSISNNFYNYFNNITFLSSTSEICKNTSIYSSRNIHYKTSYKQTRFNEKISREHYKNRRVANMVQCPSWNELFLL